MLDCFFKSNWKCGSSFRKGLGVEKLLSLEKDNRIFCVAMKCFDTRKNTGGESGCLVQNWRCSAKVWGSKGIRYPCSSHRQRWILALGISFQVAKLTRKVSHLRTMTARLKLKEIGGSGKMRWSMRFNATIRANLTFIWLIFIGFSLFSRKKQVLFCRCCMVVVSSCCEVLG